MVTTFGAPERLAAVLASRSKRETMASSPAYRSERTFAATVRPRAVSVAL